MPRFGFVGPSYTLQSSEVASEECINFFAETNESGGAFDIEQVYGGREFANIKSYYGTPGLKTFVAFTGKQVRGSYTTGSRLFVVVDSQLIEVSSTGSQTVWGSVANDGNAVSMCANSIQLLVVSGGHAYCFGFTSAAWASTTQYLVGTQIVDPQGQIQKATAAAWAPSTAYALGAQIVDANGNIQQAYAYGWAATTAYAVGFEIVDSHGNIQQVTTAGTSGAVAPAWAGAGTTTDGTVVWTYQGASDGNAGISGGSVPTWSTTGFTGDGTGTLFWDYVGGSGAYAGTSGNTVPTFNDSGGSTPDGAGTLVWVNIGARLLDVTSQLAGNPIQCDCSDTYGIVIFQNSNKFQISQVLDFSTWPGQLVNEVSVFAENLVSIIVNHRELWVFGSKRSQPYEDTGSAEAFDPIPGALIETGCAATFSVSRLDNSVFWIGQDERGAVIAWRSNGYTPSRISTHAVEVWLSQQANIAGLVTYSYQDRGHLFWVLYVPGSDCSWVYDVGENLWHKRAAWVNGVYTPHFSWNHAYAFGMHLVGDWNSANLYQMSFNYYDDNGLPIRRLRQAPTLKQELERVYHAELKVDFDVGLGPQPPLVDGDNAPRAPQAMLQWSNDGGKTWGNEHVRGCGMAGQTMTFVRWQRLGESRRRTYRLVVTDPIQWSIVDAYLRLDSGQQQ